MFLLTTKNLWIDYYQNKKAIPAVRGVDISIEPGQTLGLVGESGCGKSTLALSLLGLLPKENSKIRKGEILYEGENISSLSDLDWLRIRGKKIAMIFQDPFSALNPVLTIEKQLQESIELDMGSPNRNRAIELLSQVKLTDPDRILQSYPHQISGGQRQRILIALALARRPNLLIADEPTTALDVTVQDEIITLLSQLQKTLHMAMLFVTHNMGLVKSVASHLAVMYAGEIIESGQTTEVLTHPKHPYTQGLLRCIPKMVKTNQPIPVLDGQPPKPDQLPSGCAFHIRCPKVFDRCSIDNPQTRSKDQQRVRCHLYES